MVPLLTLALDRARDDLGPMAPPVAVALSSAGSFVVVPGPELVIVFGVSVPVLSAGLGVLGVVLGLLMAPAPAAPIGARRTAALWVSLIGIELALVVACSAVAGKALLPLVAMGWGIGLGWSGLAVAQLLAEQVLGGIRRVTGAFIEWAAARAGGGGKDKADE
ncbi:hypothetical protein [Sphingomonas canadensis]|nr:hypothetical protein [Sphingomonas canadensis]